MSPTQLRESAAFTVTIGALAVLGLACGPPQAVEPTPTDELWQQATLIFEPLPEAAPNPDNPVTQQPFPYELHGTRAVLEVPAPKGGAPRDAVRYEIVVAP